jgi:hypothetical protein
MLSREIATRRRETPQSATFPIFARAGNRLEGLLDPDQDLAASPLRPLPSQDALMARKLEIETELAPAGLRGAALAVNYLFVIKKPAGHVVAHQVEFQQAMIGALARFSMLVLAEALRKMNDSAEEWVSVAGVMVQLCEKQVAWRRDELRNIARHENELKRRRKAEEEEADRQRADATYIAGLATKLGNAVAVEDIGLAHRLLPILRRSGRSFTWSDALHEPWAPQLVCALALIARQQPADRETAVAAACEAAGLDKPPAPGHRLRPREMDAGPRRLSDIFATLPFDAASPPPREKVHAEFDRSRGDKTAVSGVDPELQLSDPL